MTYDATSAADLRTYGTIRTHVKKTTDRLYALALTGDKAAREKRSVGNLPRVITLVQRLLYTHSTQPTLSKMTCCSEGFTATVEAVNTLISLAKPNPDPSDCISSRRMSPHYTRRQRGPARSPPAEASLKPSDITSNPLLSTLLPDTLYADADTTCELRRSHRVVFLHGGNRLINPRHAEAGMTFGNYHATAT